MIPVTPPTADAWRAIPPRDRYARAALAAMPRLLGLLDRNRFSPAYGSFDRAYWHYRTMDFPCGMAQEMVLPLALAHALPLPGGDAYRSSERLRDLALAAMHHARTTSHADGTCDDYFPFERAMGALVFALYAMTESCLLLGLDKAARPGDRYDALLAFFARRGDHLAAHNETGQLSNHQAYAALALYNVYLLTGEERFRRASDERLALTLSWQHADGWFQEYEGADPGYHTCSIDFLAKLWQKSAEPRILESLGRAVDFAAHFLHPDGSYGGEYGSRNTYHFYPHGFEVMAAQGNGRARWIADMFLHRALPEGRRYFNDDDRMAAHYVYDWMQAWRDFAPRPAGDAPPRVPEPVARTFDGTGLVVRRDERTHLVANLRKGGVFKLFAADGPLASDTGPMLRLRDGSVLVTHLMDASDELRIEEEGARLVTRGRFCRRKHKLATPWTQILFRAFTTTVGRFAPNLVRATLQKILITGKRRTEFTFERTIALRNDAVEVVDIIAAPNPPGGTPREVVEAAIGSDATSIYVANSNTFQESILLPWIDLADRLGDLNARGRVEVRRTIAIPPSDGGNRA